MRFIDLDGERISSDAIQGFYFAGGVRMIVELKDGTTRSFDTGKAGRHHWERVLSGAEHITQIVPCQVPLWQVWKNEGGSHFAERIYFLAVCADGGVEGVTSQGGYFGVEGDANSCGLYYGHELAQFKDLERFDPGNQSLSTETEKEAHNENT